MFQSEQVVFKKLNKLPLTRRLSVANSPEGKSILGSLTPSQLAELFPRYYQQALPDIGGFDKATTQAARERQAEASEGILDRIMRAEKGLEEYAGEKYHQLKRKLGFEPKAPAGLTPEQEAAWNKIITGPLDINSVDGKLFGKLTDQQLNGLGISRTKDNTGRDVFQYAAPEVGVEEAKSRLRTSGSTKNSSEAKSAAENYLGRPMSDREWDMVVKTTAAEATSHKGETALVMASILNRAKSGKYGGNSIEGVISSKAQFSSYTNGSAFREPGDSRRQSIYQSASMLGGVSHEQTDFASYDPAAYSKEGGRGQEKINERLSRGFTKVGGQIFNAAHLSNLTESNVSIKPEGPNGDFSDDQINKMMVQLRDEKNSARKQQLANLLVDSGVPTATVNKIEEGGGATATSSEAWSSIQPIGGQSYCGRGVANLAEQIYGREHFDNPGHLGNSMASDLSYGARGNNKFSRSGMYKAGQSIGQEALTPQFLSSLPPGTIISAGGGRSDGAGHIQMKVGNKWASDHWQNDFSFGRRDGRMYKDFVIHYPSDQGLAIMQKKGLVTNVSVSPTLAEAPLRPTAAPVPKMDEIEDDKDLPNVRPDEQQVIDKAREDASKKSAGPVSQPTLEAPPSVPQPTATVIPPQEAPKAPKALPNKYTVDRAGFIAAIKNTEDFKNTPFSFMASEQQIIDGFNSDAKVQAAGVRYDAEKGIMHFKDPSHPEIQNVMRDLHTDTFMKPIEEKKKEEPKPKVEAPPPTPKPIPEKKPETPAPTPQAQTTAPSPKAAPTPSPPQQTPASQPEAKPVQNVPSVPGASDGGSFNVPDQVDFYPMDKRDNMAAVDTKTQQPLFTARGGEKIDITPSQKVQGNMAAPDNGMRNEFDALRQEMGSNFGTAGEAPKPVMQQVNKQQNPDSMPVFTGKLNEQNRSNLYHNPAFERAMMRTRLQETGDQLNGHFSNGNTNY